MTEMEFTEEACPRCLPLAGFGRIRAETVQRLPKGAHAPLSMDDNKPCCFDCAAADTLVKMNVILSDDDSMTHFLMARIAVGNDRQEQYRLPGVEMGLVKAGFVKASEQGDLKAQWDWLDRHKWFGLHGVEDGW
jgi:hypothetical protein